MAPKPKVPSFGSQEYWDQRFTKDPNAFDWLSAPESLDPFIVEALNSVDDVEPQILHVGCGSSLLSHHLKMHVHQARQVHNVDYSAVVIDAERKRDLEKDVNGSMRWDAVDLLDCRSLLATCDARAYSVIVDKSTSDAISCADDVVCPLPYAVTTTERTVTDELVEIEPKEIAVHPLHVMAVHLGLVTKPGARWISLSYNSERYPFLEGSAAHVEEDGTADTGIPDPRLLWTAVGKHQIEAKEQDAGSGSAATHRPKVYHWVYVLQRTSERLFVHKDQV